MLTVSRSVDRVFQIMELFALKRLPLSATEIHQTLKMPHSSAVSVLARMVDMGYLDQNCENKRFFPSVYLNHLCGRLPDAIVGGNPLADLVDRVQHATDETTSISRLDELFTMPIYVRSAKHAHAWRVTPGLSGGLATHSVVGRTLLSTLPDIDLRRFIERANQWASRTRGVVPDSEHILRAVEFVREHGYLCRYNLLLPGIGAISCPLPAGRHGERLAVTVAGSVDRMQLRGRQITNALLQEVRCWHRNAAVVMADAPVGEALAEMSGPALCGGGSAKGFQRDGQTI